MLDILLGLFMVLVLLDVVAWLLVLGVAGIVHLVNRLFAILNPYR